MNIISSYKCPKCGADWKEKDTNGVRLWACGSEVTWQSKTCRIAEMLPDTELLQADGFDEAIIGYAEVWTGKGHGIVMAYDRDKCIDVLVDRDGMERDEAVEYFQFNVAGAYVGEMTPCFVTMWE